LGLVNCRERMRILYGSSQLLETKSFSGKFEVIVKIPFELK
jgi:hypothetical protein